MLLWKENRLRSENTWFWGPCLGDAGCALSSLVTGSEPTLSLSHVFPSKMALLMPDSQGCFEDQER